MDERPCRKAYRLPQYDYSQNGAYFITICTQNHKILFGEIGTPNPAAAMVGRTFAEVLGAYPSLDCPCFVVMPNHFHALLVMNRADTGSAPTLSVVVQAFKRLSTHRYIQLVRQGKALPFDRRVWQRSFYDHVVRSQEDYCRIAEYISANPARWMEDRFHPARQNERIAP